MSKLLRTLSDDTTIHGIPDMVAEKRSMLRVCWLVCFGVALAYCGVLVRETLQVYLSKPLSIATRPDPQSGFLEISYCPYSWINGMKSNMLGYSDSDVARILSSLPPMGIGLAPREYSEIYAPMVSSIPDTYNNIKNSGARNFTEVVLSIGFDPEELIESVELFPFGNKTRYKLTKKASAGGSCIVIHVDEQYDPPVGAFASLTVKMRQFDHYFPGANSRAYDLWQFGNPNTVVPIAITKTRTGEDTVMHIRRDRLKLISTATIPCSVTTTADGYARCQIGAALRVCEARGGLQWFVPYFADDFDDMLNKVNFTEVENCGASVEYFRALRKISSSCPLPCEYEIASVANVLYRNSAQSPRTNDTVTAVIKFRNPVQGNNIIEEAMFPTTMCVSMIGGIVSLWTGASLISVMQILCLLAQRLM